MNESMEDFETLLAQEMWERWERETRKHGLTANELPEASESFFYAIRDESDIRMSSYRECAE